MKITFVRHTSVDVKPGVCYGRTDVAVSETFESEAIAVKDKLSRLEKENATGFDIVYKSPLTRCRLLADFCGYTDAIPDERLLELNFGDWEMRKYDDIRDPKLQEWFDDWLNVAPPGGESFSDQTNRVKSFIADMKKSGKESVLVFCHAGIIMNAMLLTGKADINNIFSQQPAYGSLTRLDF